MPNPGDVSVCMYCAGILIFNQDMTVREPGIGELMHIEKWPEVQEIQRDIRRAKAKLS